MGFNLLGSSFRRAFPWLNFRQGNLGIAFRQPHFFGNNWGPRHERLG